MQRRKQAHVACARTCPERKRAPQKRHKRKHTAYTGFTVVSLDQPQISKAFHRPSTRKAAFSTAPYENRRGLEQVVQALQQVPAQAMQGLRGTLDTTCEPMCRGPGPGHPGASAGGSSRSRTGDQSYLGHPYTKPASA